MVHGAVYKLALLFTSILLVQASTSRFVPLLEAGQMLKKLSPPHELRVAGESMIEGYYHLDESESWEACALCLAVASENLLKSSKHVPNPDFSLGLRGASVGLYQASNVVGCIVQASAASPDVESAAEALLKASKSSVPESDTIEKIGISLKSFALALAERN